MLLNNSTPTITEFENTLNRVLDKPSYRHLRYSVEGTLEKLKEALQQWLEKRLDSIFESRGAINPATAGDISNLLMVVGLTIIFAVIIIIAVRINKTMDDTTKVREILGEQIDDKTTPTGLRRKAADYEAEGKLRLAIRYDFIGLLLLMHNKNLVYLDEAKTNEELYKALNSRGFVGAGEFKKLTALFNSSWYGHKAPHQEAYNGWKQNIGELWKEVLAYEEKTK